MVSVNFLFGGRIPKICCILDITFLHNIVDLRKYSSCNLILIYIQLISNYVVIHIRDRLIVEALQHLSDGACELIL